MAGCDLAADPEPFRCGEGGGGSTEPVMLAGRVGRAASKGPRGASICTGRGIEAAPGRMTGSGLVGSVSSSTTGRRPEPGWTKP
jgi:hypothetical protein